MPSRRILGSALALLALALLVSSASAQTGSLRGKVIDESGQGLRDAMVYIERIGVRGNYKVKTNKRGNYFHAGLPLGQYNVRLEIDGKEVWKVGNYQMKLGEPQPLNFDLGEIKQEQQAAQSGTGPSREQLSAMSEAQRKEYEKALKARQQQISKNKKLNETFNAAMEAKRLEDWDTAVQQFKAAAEIDAEQDVIWGNLAEALSGMIRTKTGADRDAIGEEAIAAYRKALELKPDPAYHNNMGPLLLIRLGRVDEGSAELETAAEMAPDSAGTYYFNLGATMVNTGNTERAIEAFRKATEAQPDFANAYYQLATVLVGTAKMNEDGSVVPAPGTVEAYQKYLDLDPQGPFAASAQAMVQSLSGTLETTFEQPKKRRKSN